MLDVISTIADDNSLIPYRKELNKITGSVTATILLQQLLHRYKLNNNKPFYKFIEPCKNELYKKGDSWCEELGFTVKEFKTAYKKLEEKGIVSKKTNMMRITYYDLNLDKLNELLKGLYVKSERAIDSKVQKGYSVKSERAIDYSKSLDRDNQRDTKNKNIQKDFSFSLTKSTQFEHTSSEYQDKLKAYAVSKDGAYSYQEFLDHHLAKGSKFKDWSRAYNTWINNSIKFNKFDPTAYIKKLDHPTLEAVYAEFGTNRAYDTSTLRYLGTFKQVVKTEQPQQQPEQQTANKSVEGIFAGLAESKRVL